MEDKRCGETVPFRFSGGGCVDSAADPDSCLHGRVVDESGRRVSRARETTRDHDRWGLAMLPDTGDSARYVPSGTYTVLWSAPNHCEKIRRWIVPIWREPKPEVKLPRDQGCSRSPSP